MNVSLSETSAALCFLLILLVPLAGAGLALINAGLGRSRSAAHAMLASLCAVSVAAIVYWIVGFSWQGAAGRPGYAIILGARAWNWIASEPFFLRGVHLDFSPVSLVFLLQMFSVGLAALIPISSGSDRWRLGAVCASTALLAACTYPLFAHWVWGGGWLAGLGANYGLGRGFLDAGGSGTIQVVGGLTALSITWILGPRRENFPPKESRLPFPATTPSWFSPGAPSRGSDGLASIRPVRFCLPDPIFQLAFWSPSTLLWPPLHRDWQPWWLRVYALAGPTRR